MMRKGLIIVFLVCTWQVTYGVDERIFVQIGGIQQHLWIKGSSVESPVLLFFHGGPGNSMMGYAHKFCSRLYDKFVVVHWDQRNSGETLQKNEDTGKMTVDRFEADAVEVISYLQGRFHRDRIFIAGHSWGGFLALLVAGRHPELLSGCFAVCPMVNQLESEQRTLEEMRQKLGNDRDTLALRELSTVEVPFENGEQLYADRKWISLMEGRTPGFSRQYVSDWSRRWLDLFNEASRFNLVTEFPVIKCPVVFFVGRRDQQTRATITEFYFNGLNAKYKQLHWFEKSGHQVPTQEPQKFQELIEQELLSIKSK